MDPVITRLLGVLEQLHEAKGVPKQESLVNKNIIKSDNSTFDSDEKVKSGLDSKHKKTLTEAFTLFNKMFFEYQSHISKSEPIILKGMEIKSPKTPPPLPPSYVENINNTTNVQNNESVQATPTPNRRVWVDKFNLFNKMFFEYQKRIAPDTKQNTLVSKISNEQQRHAPQKVVQKTEGSGFLKTLLGGLGILAGMFLFLKGLMTDGPLKGILKILSKIGIQGGLKILKAGISALGHFLGKVFKFPLEIINNLGKGLLDNVFRTVFGGIKTFIGNIGESIGRVIGKVLPKGGKGFFGKLAGKIINILKPAARLLKRIPIIGTLISVGFAISRFKSGDTVGGVIDVLSGLVGLLDLVVPGLGFGLSLGLDLLNAFLDVKAGGSNSEASVKKSTILMDMAKSVGSWIWKNAEYLPILGTIKWFGKAYDSFKGGNFVDGIKEIGLGLVSVIPGGGVLIKGVEALMGFLSGKSETDPTLTANKTWFSKLKDWIKTKLKDLPWWIKKPLAWFGIMEDDTDTSSTVFDTVGAGVKSGFDKTKQFFGGIWDSIKDPIGDSVGSISGFASNIWSNTKDFVSKAWDSSVAEASKIWTSVKDLSSKAWDKAKEAGSWFASAISDMASKTKEMINQWIPNIVDTITGLANSAMDVLKNIASRVGGWIAELFTIDEKEKLESVKKETTPTEKLVKGSDDMNLLLAKQGNTQTQWLNMLHTSSLEQVRLLGMVVNIGNSSLQELKRISGNKGGSGGTNIIVPAQSSPKTPMLPVDNNRMGFAGSAYALS